MNEQILNQLCEEIKRMDENGKRYYQEKWRARYGYVYSLASIFDMAVELAKERKIEV